MTHQLFVYSFFRFILSFFMILSLISKRNSCFCYLLCFDVIGFNPVFIIFSSFFFVWSVFLLKECKPKNNVNMNLKTQKIMSIRSISALLGPLLKIEGYNFWTTFSCKNILNLLHYAAGKGRVGRRFGTFPTLQIYYLTNFNYFLLFQSLLLQNKKRMKECTNFPFTKGEEHVWIW